MNKDKCEQIANKIMVLANELYTAVLAIKCDSDGYVFSDKNRAKAKRRSLDITDQCVELRKALYEW